MLPFERGVCVRGARSKSVDPLVEIGAVGKGTCPQKADLGSFLGGILTFPKPSSEIRRGTVGKGLTLYLKTYQHTSRS